MENLTRVDGLLKGHAPESVAIIYNDEYYRYRDLYEGMIKVAGNLVGYNVYTDKIIVLLGNRPEAIMAIMGISYAGGTFIPLPSTIKAHRLQEILEDSGATAIITDGSFDKVLEGLNHDELHDLRLVFDIDVMMPPSNYLCSSVPNDIAALMYTSGTTGKSKGVICPPEKIMAAVSSINAYLMHTHDDVIATALPLSHGYGLYQILTLLEAGGTILLEDNFAYPARTLERIKKHHATGFAAVPSMIHMMMDIPGWEDYCDSLTYITTAGAALPSKTFQMLTEILDDVEIIPMYGQAECVRTLAYPGSFQRIEGVYFNSCGKTIPDTETCILDRDGKTMPFGEGELLVRSPHVMDGYLNNPEETAKTFKDGWLHTGDIFAIDGEGRHFFVGRKDDVVKIKGERCAPIELDNALMLMPGVFEAAAFAVQDNLWGNRFVVFVSHREELVTKNQVMRFCKKHLEGFLMPKDVVVVEDIPKNGTGKISRQYLKELYEASSELQC